MNVLQKTNLNTDELDSAYAEHQVLFFKKQLMLASHESPEFKSAYHFNQ